MKQFKVIKSITNRDNDVLNVYLKDVSRIPMLKADEELELSRQIKMGNKKALDKLVISNLRFVISVAKQYQNQGLDLLDLINEGNLGLIKAAEKFDGDKGFKFISYAVWWIRQSIMKALSDSSRTIRLPISQSTNIIKILKTINTFEQQNERKPSDEELSKLLRIEIDKINNILSANTNCVSIETPFGGEEDGCLLDVIPNKNSPSSDVIIKEEDSVKHLDNLLDHLTIRERDILVMSFGLKNVQALPYEDIGARFGLTGERVRQIKEEIIEKIRNNFKDLAKELL